MIADCNRRGRNETERLSILKDDEANRKDQYDKVLNDLKSRKDQDGVVGIARSARELSMKMEEKRREEIMELKARLREFEEIAKFRNQAADAVKDMMGNKFVTDLP